MTDLRNGVSGSEFFWGWGISNVLGMKEILWYQIGKIIWIYIDRQFGNYDFKENITPKTLMLEAKYGRLSENRHW